MKILITSNVAKRSRISSVQESCSSSADTATNCDHLVKESFVDTLSVANFIGSTSTFIPDAVSGCNDFGVLDSGFLGILRIRVKWCWCFWVSGLWRK